MLCPSEIHIWRWLRSTFCTLYCNLDISQEMGGAQSYLLQYLHHLRPCEIFMHITPLWSWPVSLTDMVSCFICGGYYHTSAPISPAIPFIFSDKLTVSVAGHKGTWPFSKVWHHKSVSPPPTIQELAFTASKHYAVKTFSCHVMWLTLLW